METTDVRLARDAVMPPRGSVLHVTQRRDYGVPVTTGHAVCGKEIKFADVIPASALYNMDLGFKACRKCFAHEVPIGFENVEQQRFFEGWR